MSPELPRPERGSGDKKPKPLPERSRVWGRSREGPRGVRSPRSPQRREYLFIYLFVSSGRGAERSLKTPKRGFLAAQARQDPARNAAVPLERPPGEAPPGSSPSPPPRAIPGPPLMG